MCGENFPNFVARGENMEMILKVIKIEPFSLSFNAPFTMAHVSTIRINICMYECVFMHTHTHSHVPQSHSVKWGQTIE